MEWIDLDTKQINRKKRYENAPEAILPPAGAHGPVHLLAEFQNEAPVELFFFRSFSSRGTRGRAATAPLAGDWDRALAPRPTDALEGRRAP